MEGPRSRGHRSRSPGPPGETAASGSHQRQRSAAAVPPDPAVEIPESLTLPVRGLMLLGAQPWPHLRYLFDDDCSPVITFVFVLTAKAWSWFLPMFEGTAVSILSCEDASWLKTRLFSS